MGWLGRPGIGLTATQTEFFFIKKDFEIKQESFGMDVPVCDLETIIFTLIIKTYIKKTIKLIIKRNIKRILKQSTAVFYARSLPSPPLPPYPSITYK